MSQIYKSLSSGPTPPAIPDQFTVDVNGPAIPVANNLNVYGRDSTANDVDGIRTNNDPNGSATVYVELTNRLQGSTTTVGAVTGDIITFAPTVTGTYTIEYRVAAYNVTGSIGAGYSMFGAIRFDGVNANICDIFDEIVNEEGTMSSVDLSVVVSGANIILRATGYAAQTINWSAVGLYTFIGV